MIVVAAVCLLSGMASIIGLERLWRRTQAAVVLGSYPWRARMAVRRGSRSSADDRTPMALLKATRIRLDFERRLGLVQFLGLGLLFGSMDLFQAATGPHRATPISWELLGLAQGIGVLVAWAITFVRTGRRRRQLEAVIEMRERVRAGSFEAPFASS